MKELKALKLYEIKSGIPVPVRGVKAKPVTDLFKPMKVGDVIRLTQKEKNAAHICAKSHGYKVTVRTIGKDVFVWRLA